MRYTNFKLTNMKKIIIFTLLSLTLTSCHDEGETSLSLDGNKHELPEELKGLKVYWVATGKASGVQVAVLNNQVNSLTYAEGKTQETVIMVNKSTNKIYEISEVLMENDSIMVVKKIK